MRQLRTSWEADPTRIPDCGVCSFYYYAGKDPVQIRTLAGKYVTIGAEKNNRAADKRYRAALALKALCCDHDHDGAGGGGGGGGGGEGKRWWQQ
jgi:hypothetical protein